MKSRRKNVTIGLHYKRIGNDKVKKISFCNTILIIINVVIFCLLELIGSTNDIDFMVGHGAMFWPLVIENRQIYRLFSYMFLHFGFSHLFNNMLVMFAIGDIVERAVGKIKYLFIYFISGILAGLASMVYNIWQENIVVSAGASGAIFGLVGAMLYIVIINKGHVEDLSSRQLALFILFSLYGGFTSQGIDNIAHIGGFIAGFILAVLLYRKPVYKIDRKEVI